jgi:predicted GTPase
VDETPGTTADTVVTLMEIHSLGPFKVLDTAGVDEYSELGDKKRRKTYEAIAEADLTLVVVDSRQEDLTLEKDLFERVCGHGKQCLFVVNDFEGKEEVPGEVADRLRAFGGSANEARSIVINASDTSHQKQLTDFIRTHFTAESREVDLLPVKGKGFVLMVIPMDEETPTLRLLRPQDMAVERVLRSFAIPVLFRMDLGKARGEDPAGRNAEKQRYLDLIRTLSDSPEGLSLIVTDSQVFDIVGDWTPEEYALTSFSIMMTHYMSGGRLEDFMEGARRIESLDDGDRILIAEACNHDRQCDDIATVQLPRRIQEYTGKSLHFDFVFGRPFPEDLSGVALIIHCGACMIDRQKFAARLREARGAGVPVTNYGIALSYLRGPALLERTVKPFTSQSSINP